MGWVEFSWVAQLGQSVAREIFTTTVCGCGNRNHNRNIKYYRVKLNKWKARDTHSVCMCVCVWYHIRAIPETIDSFSFFQVSVLWSVISDRKAIDAGHKLSWTSSCSSRSVKHFPLSFPLPIFIFSFSMPMPPLKFLLTSHGSEPGWRLCFNWNLSYCLDSICITTTYRIHRIHMDAFLKLIPGTIWPLFILV